MSAARHITAAVAAVIGSGVMGTALVVMNAKAHRPPRANNELTAEFKAPEKKKKVKKELPKPKPRPRRARPNPAPRPTFSSQLAGLGAGIPVFSAGDLAGLTGDVMGGAEATKDMVMTADTVDSQPERIPELCPPPQPPSKAIKRGITGYVRVRFLVTTSGRLEGIRVVEADPEGVFEDAVVSALQSWQMRPAMYGGNPVAVSIEQPFRFQ